jgi:hypothetical protein
VVKADREPFALMHGGHALRPTLARRNLVAMTDLSRSPSSRFHAEVASEEQLVVVTVEPVAQ